MNKRRKNSTNRMVFCKVAAVRNVSRIINISKLSLGTKQDFDMNIFVLTKTNT